MSDENSRRNETTLPDDASAGDAEFVDAESVDANVVGAESLDAELLDAEIVDPNASDAELEIVDAEVIDAELVDAGPTAEEALDAIAVSADEAAAGLDDDEAIEFIPVDAPALAPTLAAASPVAPGDDDYILAEVVEDPPFPNLYQPKIRPSFDRGGITAGAHRYRERGPNLTAIGICVGLFFVIALLVGIQFIPNYQRSASQRDSRFEDEDDYYYDDDGEYTGRLGYRRTDRASGQSLREMEEEIERLRAELDSRVVVDAEAELAALIENDAAFPESALSKRPIPAMNKSLARIAFERKPRTPSFALTSTEIAGEGLTARETTIASASSDLVIEDVAWSEDGRALFVLDSGGWVTRVEADPLRSVAKILIEGAFAVECSQAGLIVATFDSLVVLNPDTLGEGHKFVGVPCESLAAAAQGSVVATLAGGEIELIDIKRNFRTHTLNFENTRWLLGEAYRETELLGEFDSVSISPDGTSLLCCSRGRWCRFTIFEENVKLVALGPRQADTLSASLSRGANGQGVIVREPIENDWRSSYGEARWFFDDDPNTLCDSVKLRTLWADIAMSGGAQAATFFLSENGHCSSYVGNSDGPFHRVLLLGEPDEYSDHVAELDPVNRGMAADPARARAAVFNGKTLWIVETKGTARGTGAAGSGE